MARPERFELSPHSLELCFYGFEVHCATITLRAHKINTYLKDKILIQLASKLSQLSPKIQRKRK